MNLNYVLATKELAVRPKPEGFAQTQPLNQARRTFSSLVELVEHGVTTLGTDAVGISQFSDGSGPELKWVAVAGTMREYEDRRFPLRHSMCGICFETGRPQLFVHPERFFKWMGVNGIGAIEALVAPVLSEQGAFLGTIWAMRHLKTSASFNQVHVEVLQVYALEVARLLLLKQGR